MPVKALENHFLKKKLREIDQLEGIITRLGPLARHQIIDYAEYKGHRYPLHAVTLGSDDPHAPSLGLFGGVHGLEKIGSEVILSYLETLSELLEWDETLHERLKKTRIVFFPIVNPIGIVLRTRANGNGVDIMRNSPLEAEPGPRNRIFSGHRLSNKLPWFRGELGADMEVETRAMIRVFKDQMMPSQVSLAIDVHSGFGVQDQLWFPYAHSRKPFPHLAEMMALKNRFDQSYPHHFYVIEPVSRNYLVNGDLWDYLYLNRLLDVDLGLLKGVFIPMTLEMGSWLWLKKNPRQIFDSFGLFHPILPHRHHRIMRRHLTLFDFFHRSILHSSSWAQIQNETSRQRLTEDAINLWYERK